MLEFGLIFDGGNSKFPFCSKAVCGMKMAAYRPSIWLVTMRSLGRIRTAPSDAAATAANRIKKISSSSLIVEDEAVEVTMVFTR